MVVMVTTIDNLVAGIVMWLAMMMMLSACDDDGCDGDDD